MRAIIQNNRIVKFTAQPGEGIEIGTPPPNCGLERLYWTGEELIDLMTCSEFYVDSSKKLHPIQSLDTQKVIMEYKDRKKLTRKDGIWKVKTDQEIEEEKENLDKERKRLQVKRKLKKEVGHNEEIIEDLIRFILNNSVESKEKLKKYLQVIEKIKT